MSNNERCLDFWYFMYGANVGTLSVIKISGITSLTRWTNTGGKGYEWYHGQVNVKSSGVNPLSFNVCSSFALLLIVISYFLSFFVI